MAGFFLAYFLFFLLYMVVAIYGAQVMNGVIEEKTSRVVEVRRGSAVRADARQALFGIGSRRPHPARGWTVAARAAPV
jgi:hypothetical protein